MIDFTKKTILFGGSFNPVHEGHLHVAQEVMKQTPEAEQLVFIPTALSPGKLRPEASAEERLAWLRAILKGHPFLVWEEELNRGGESFTVDTLRKAHELGARKSTLFWLLGADAYQNFPAWKQPEEIRKLCQLLVVNRPGEPVEAIHPDDRILNILPHSASSTAIRASLAKEARRPPGLPLPVWKLIENALPENNPYARKLRDGR